MIHMIPYDPFSLLFSVTWRRDNTVLTGGANCVLKVEGDRHSLLIKSAKPSDGGKYSITAVNEVGKVSTSSTLVVKAGN